ncbi:carbohydrate kinase family protein [Geotoga petraea]|jgi:pseudouridine kinase|uniref:Pseudouridine kinase n=1 Tax=Geotoga petraea TaxID=28234 RepID=A0A1G6JUG1_9BACT|nr:carbohydrate kinase family protein [Geotoga petraea]MDK2945644.1 pseudouridine kinase [Geotoga sp.]SDC22035.1 pseudouridine kinase [Geotoga petraea]
MKVTIIGGINYDLTITSLNKIIPFDSNPSKINYSPGGVGRNIAEVLGKAFYKNHKHEITMLGAVGLDFEGEFVLKETENAGVNCKNVKKDKKISTGKYITFNDVNNDMYVAANDMSIYDHISKEDILLWENILKSTEILLIDTNLNIEIINKVLSLTPKNIITIIETVSMNKILKLKGLRYDVDILKTNKNEFMYFYNLDEEHQIFEKCKNIKSFHDIIITNKEKEVLYYSDQKMDYIKTISSDVINSNGAGDSFTAGLVYGLMNNFSIIKSIEYGNVFASLSLRSEKIFPSILKIEKINEIYRRSYDED